MEKWKPLNMEIRSWAISRVLRIEQTSSSALKAIFRMFKHDPKTLGNKSSALSLKAKIDLLYDLEEIDKTDYNHFQKLMEVRNQFAHNHNAVSFSSFKEINPDVIKYLLECCPEGIKGNDEEKLMSGFDEIFKFTAGKLSVIEIEYTNGIEKEMQRYINHIVVENMDAIWQSSVERYRTDQQNNPMPFLTIGGDDIEKFHTDFSISMSKFILDELKKIEGKENSILKRKETMEERIKAKVKAKSAPDSGTE